MLEETLKLRLVVQQPVVYLLPIGRQIMPSSNLVVEQVAGFHGIVHGVVQFVHLQFIVLQKMVIGPFGEQQGRQKQCVNNRRIVSQCCIFQVVPDDIMPTNSVAHRHESIEVGLRVSVQHCTILPDRSVVRHLLRLRIHLRVNEYYHPSSLLNLTPIA